jgi:hypothetical protein
VELSAEATQALRDIADAAEAAKGLADQLLEADEAEDMFGALLAVTVRGSELRDLAVGLYVRLTDKNEGEGG